MHVEVKKENSPPEEFAVEVSSEMPDDLIASHPKHVNTLLRLCMLAGVPMRPDTTFQTLADFATEITGASQALIFSWDETHDSIQLRVARNVDDVVAASFDEGNILNVWTTSIGRPLLVPHGRHSDADRAMDHIGARTALAVPLFVQNRIIGSLQLFSAADQGFTEEQAQLMWTLALIAEPMLTRDYINEGLIRFAFTDYLTGLKTRGYFEQQLDLEMKRYERRRSKFALVMVDIDFFKRINDQYGHAVGDQLLREIAAMLLKEMREVDTAARYGGEEFVLVLPDTTEEGARFVAQRIRRAVETSRFFAGAPHVVERITVSLGIGIFPDDAKFKRELVEAADVALYTAKARGRNQVISFSDLRRSPQREVS